MASFYQRMQGTVARLLGTYGAPAVFTRVITGAYKPGTGEHEGGETVIWSANAVMTGLNEKFLDGSRIKAGDMQILVDCHGQKYRPKMGDSVTFTDGATWNVMQDMPVMPAEITVLYKGIVRKG